LNIKEYISSGILELYVLGQLSLEEQREVEDMQAKHEEIRREIHEISLSMEKYAQLSGIKPPENVATQLFENLPGKTPNKQQTTGENNSSSGVNTWKISSILFALSALVGFMMYFQQKSDYHIIEKKLDKQQKFCDSITSSREAQYAILNQINNPGNKIINLTPTASFEKVVVYLHHNSENKKNFLQLVNLPDINQNQAYQLWSLKEGQAPQPLDVFVNKNTIIPVNFVDNTATYAITIEDKNGSLVPSLDQLIGTMQVL